MSEAKFKARDFDIKITYGKGQTAKFKTLNKTLDRAMKTSQKMCELRQEIIDRAINWRHHVQPLPIGRLMKAVKVYEAFKSKHFPEKTK